MRGLTGITLVVILMLFAILSLAVASNGQAGMPYWAGLGFFVFCVVLSFYFVHLMTGEKRGRH